MLRKIGLALLLLAQSAVLQALELSPYSATYRFNLDNKLSGTATRTLERRGVDLWRYTFSANATIASAIETSDFRFDGQRVIPLGYQQRRDILFSKKKSGIRFDWTARQGTGTRDSKEPVTFPLGAGILDGLNMEIQLRRDLVDLGKLAGPYALATPKELSPLEFVIEGAEVLNTGMGKLNTLRVRRKHKDPTRHTTFWLARDHDMLPAKVVQHDGDTVYELEITRFSDKLPAMQEKTPANKTSAVPEKTTTTSPEQAAATPDQAPDAGTPGTGAKPTPTDTP